MSNLSKQTTLAEYKATLSHCIVMMLAGMKTYGKTESGALLDSWLAATWNHVPIEWLRPTADWFNGNGGEFPTAAEFKNRALELEHVAGIESTLEATKRREKELDRIRCEELAEKYPTMDREAFREIFKRTADKYDATRLTVQHGDLSDPEQERKIDEQKRRMREA